VPPVELLPPPLESLPPAPGSVPEPADDAAAPPTLVGAPLELAQASKRQDAERAWQALEYPMSIRMINTVQKVIER